MTSRQLAEQDEVELRIRADLARTVERLQEDCREALRRASPKLVEWRWDSLETEVLGIEATLAKIASDIRSGSTRKGAPALSASREHQGANHGS